VSSNTNVVAISRAQDKKAAILEALGDLSEYEVQSDEVLVATYVRNKVTDGGVHLPDSTVNEDRYQGKAGLILKMGPRAFKFERLVERGEGRFEVVHTPFPGRTPQVGDWVMYFTHDTRELLINKTSCRITDADSIKMVIPTPQSIY
jgi:co-chaperonin GroES (HSP10)